MQAKFHKTGNLTPEPGDCENRCCDSKGKATDSGPIGEFCDRPYCALAPEPKLRPHFNDGDGSLLLLCKTDGIGCECESDRLYEEELENEKRALQKRLDEESHDCEMCCKCGEFITIDPNCIHCKYHGHVCYCKIICDQCGYSGNDCNCY